MKYIFAVLCLAGSLVCSAQQMVQQAEGFKYLEALKNATDSEADLPVIIGFHYSSSTPKVTIEEYDQVTGPFRIILPQGNFRKRSGFTYFPPDYYSKDSLTQMAIPKITVDSIARFVKAIGEKYKRKPIVAGFSQGGDISFLLAIYYPELITAAFPLAGFVHRQRMDDIKLHSHKAVPISVYQGEDDKIVSVAYSKRGVKELGKYFLISLKTYPGLGHDFSPQMKKDYAARMSDFFR
jgi:phospholipase/carboxylesterase